MLRESDSALQKNQKLKFSNAGLKYTLKAYRRDGVMGSRRLFSALAISCSALAASSAWAATVEPGYGDLTINQGRGFKPIQSGLNANVGDSVMVGPAGSATIVYDDGCRVPVQPGAVATIAPLSPCASGSYAADMALKAPPPAVAPTPTGYEFNPVFWAIWLGGVGFLTYEIVRSSSHHETTPSPASP